MTASSSCRQSSASANQSSVRRHNQRLILSAIRRAGTLTKADLAASTGLTAQSVTVIVRELEGAGLLVRGAAHKGRIGQPSIPLAINPEGAFSVGLKIGRRRSALALVDFGGRIHKSAELYHRLPTPQGIFDFVASQWSNMLAPLSSEQGVDLLGLGVAMPFELWQWAEQMGAHAEQVMAWKQVDIARELTTLTGCEVSVENDATSACAAEFAFASTPRTASFGYLYIGYFIGGGIVLNGTVFAGLAGNAGAFGSMPVRARDGQLRQLIDCASLALLARDIEARGDASETLWQGELAWSEYAGLVDAWIAAVSSPIAEAIAASCSVIDFQHFVIDGAFPSAVRAALVNAVARELAQLSLPGLRLPALNAGALQGDPRLVGAACLPFYKRALLGQGYHFNEE